MIDERILENQKYLAKNFNHADNLVCFMVDFCINHLSVNKHRRNR